MIDVDLNKYAKEYFVKGEHGTIEVFIVLNQNASYDIVRYILDENKWIQTTSHKTPSDHIKDYQNKKDFIKVEELHKKQNKIQYIENNKAFHASHSI